MRILYFLKQACKCVLGLVAISGVTQVPESAWSYVLRGPVRAEYRIMLSAGPEGRLTAVHPRSSFRSHDQFKLELRAPQATELRVWAVKRDRSVEQVRDISGDLPRDTTVRMPRGEQFEMDSNAGRESLYILTGVPKALPSTTRWTSQQEFEQEIVRVTSACKAEVTDPAPDGEQWAAVRSRCENEMPLLIEVVLQHVD